MPHLWKTVTAGLAGLLTTSLSKLTPGEVEMVAKHVFSRAKGPGGERLAMFADTLHDLDSASINNLYENGEAWMVEQLRGLGFRTLFDIGANVGDWVSFAAKQMPDAEIHCFEIVPATFAKLTENVGTTPHVVLNEFGLSDGEGSVEVFLGDSHYISSMYRFSASDEPANLTCRVRRGDEYAAERGVSAIDLVKIDVEGAEGAVIQGLSRLIDHKAVRVIQFEYNRGAIVSKFLLKDFYEFFLPRGYVLGRLTAKGVQFRDYNFAYEDFNGPNYVACLATDQEVISRISAR